MCGLLLESGADPDAEDADGDTPNALGAVGLAMVAGRGLRRFDGC